MSCNEECTCEKSALSADINCETNECGTCGGLNTNWSMENFYRSVIRTKINAYDLPPFEVKVAKIPFSPRGLSTLDGNTPNEEVVEYAYEENKQNIGKPGIITIVKRGIHPIAKNLITDGEGSNKITVDIDGEQVETTPEYNNCDYMFDHLSNSDISRDVTAQDFNIFSQYTCCKPATRETLGIVALTLDPDNPEFPIAVGANDFANCNKNNGIVRGLTKCVPDGEEIAVSWNDYATDTNPGLVKVEKLIVESNNCGDGTKTETISNGNNPLVVLDARQKAFQSTYGTVKLSKYNSNSEALASNHYANEVNVGVVKIKPTNNSICDDAGVSNDDTCPNEPVEVIQKNDLATVNDYGLVKLSKQLNHTELECPVVVTKHDWAGIDNAGIVKTERECGPGLQTVPTMCTYSDDDQLGLTYQTVDTADVNVINSDAPTTETPISTSTNDKRNFKQFIKYERSFSANGTGVGLILPAGGIDAAIDILPFNSAGYPGTGYLTKNTGNGMHVDDGQFYGYTDQSTGGNFDTIKITKSGAYNLSFIVKFRNTKAQLDTGNGETDPTTITYSARIKTVNEGKLEAGDLQTMFTVKGDPSFNIEDPRYGDFIRTIILDSNSTYYLKAGDEVYLSISKDQPECYLLYAELNCTCTQPNIT